MLALPMNIRPLAGLLLTSLLAGPAQAATPELGIREREQNLWPVIVRQSEPVARRVDDWSAAGPLIFRRPAATREGYDASGFRPFWVQLHHQDGDFRSGSFLYPLFTYAVDEHTYKWNVLEFIRRWGRRAGAEAPQSIFDRRSEFEVFPFWFSRESGDPEMNYRALFPIYGTVKNKLGFERLSWIGFPLYVENEKRGATTTSTPWPIVRITRGAAHGWGIWPLFNYVERPGVSRHETYLWPLGYNVTRYPSPDDPPGTPLRRDIGALPFYSRSTGPGYVSENYLWPFFGYTERTAPVRYSERRTFWPFLVQGRGEQRYVNRWAPFYTHSTSKGTDKRWFMWPVLRQAEWTERDVDRARTQFLYFVYWNEVQRRAGNPTAAAAQLTHVWPVFSRWDDGAGKKQWQFPSPFEVLFPGNERVRLTWSPLVTLARHDQQVPGETRTSFLWDAITYERSEREQRSEFHLGPILSIARGPAEKRIAIGNGLVGFNRRNGHGWRLFWMDFPAKPGGPAPTLR